MLQNIWLWARVIVGILFICAAVLLLFGGGWFFIALAAWALISAEAITFGALLVAAFFMVIRSIAVIVGTLVLGGLGVAILSTCDN